MGTLDGLDDEWPAGEEALHVIDVFLAELVELIDRFDALGDGSACPRSLPSWMSVRITAAGLWGARPGRR